MTDHVFGPFDAKAFGELLEHLSDRSEQVEQSHESRLRVFVEGLTDETLNDLGWLFGTCATQPELVHAMRGVLTAEYWRRHPIKAEDAGGSA